jgi:hypothetical protein
MSKKNKLGMMVVILLSVTLIIVAANWNELYCYNVDVDLCSGRICKHYYFWIIPIKKEVSDTPFSLLLNSSDVSVISEPEWYPDLKSTYIFFGKQRSGGFIQNACDTFAKAIEMSNMDRQNTRNYITQAMEYLKTKEYEKINNLAKEISSK